MQIDGLQKWDKVAYLAIMTFPPSTTGLRVNGGRKMGWGEEVRGEEVGGGD